MVEYKKCKGIKSSNTYCGKDLEINETNFEKRKGVNDYYFVNYCRICWNNHRKIYFSDPKKRQKAREANNKNYANNKEARKNCSKNARMKRLYGISDYDYGILLSAQGGVCKICKREEKVGKCGKPQKLCVDHSHITGEVRGLLCTLCNTSLGVIENQNDVKTRIQSIIEYLNLPFSLSCNDYSTSLPRTLYFANKAIF
jgi:hypothetical protein